MSIIGLFRPKWQHPKAEVRAAAIATLTDQSLLATILEQDESETVQLAAFERLTDQRELARIAKSHSPFNSRAFGGISDQRQILDVAQTAEKPELRRLAVEKIDDTVILQQIATIDADASVRRDARDRRFRLGADPMRDFLKGVLSGMPVAGSRGDWVAEISGGPDDVCGAMVCDPRFRIDGILNEHVDDAALAPTDPTESAPAPAGDARPSRVRRSTVELLAARCAGAGESENDANSTVHFRIKIWRTSEDLFHASVQYRRC